MINLKQEERRQLAYRGRRVRTSGHARSVKHGKEIRESRIGIGSQVNFEFIHLSSFKIDPFSKLFL